MEGLSGRAFERHVDELKAEMAERDDRDERASAYIEQALRRNRIRTLKAAAWTLLALAGLVLLGWGALGCAHRPATPPPPIVLSDRAGSVAAHAIAAVVGEEPRAATIPGWRAVVFQPADADDECLLVHEQVHLDEQWQAGALPWLAVYVRDLTVCAREHGQAECLRTIPQEARAYAAQHACQARRAGT